jgi:hypothetical protein
MEIWHMSKEEFWKHTKRAVKDVETGNIYLGKEGEDIHARIIERLVFREGIDLKKIEAGFILPDGSFIKRWYGEQVGNTKGAIEPIGVAEFEHDELYEYLLKREQNKTRTITSHES